MIFQLGNETFYFKWAITGNRGFKYKRFINPEITIMNISTCDNVLVSLDNCELLPILPPPDPDTLVKAPTHNNVLPQCKAGDSLGVSVKHEHLL